MIKKPFNGNWLYSEGGSNFLDGMLGAAVVQKEVTLPHDASIEMLRDPKEPNGSGNGFFHEANVSYMKKFELSEEDSEKEVFLEFEGVYQNAYVYVNRSFAGKHPYGYGNFYINATPYLKAGQENEVKVIVKNGCASGRWYTGGGIYRDVNILIGSRLHFVPDEVHLYTESLEDDFAVVKAESHIVYSGVGVKDARLCMIIRDAEGREVARDHSPVTVTEGLDGKYQNRLYINHPCRWGLDSPYLYSYEAQLIVDGKIVDTEMGTFGIRTLQLDTHYGLRINGKAVKLRGGCIHHDNGITGTAEFAHTAESRVKRLKEAGYNSIRSSHYPMGRRLLEACDRCGMIVMDEFSDVWTSTKVDFDYGTHMSDWWENDINHLVNKDFNHPSVILYSIGNEIPETGNRFDVQWGKKIADKLRELDPTRYTTNCLNLMISVMADMDKLIKEVVKSHQTNSSEGDFPGGNEINELMSNLGDRMGEVTSLDYIGDATEEAATQVDVIGYNYAAARYEKDLEKYPNRILIGSETNPWDLDYNWNLVKKHARILGDYSWTAWDYLGEAGIGKISYDVGDKGLSFYAPYPCKAAYCGDMNLIGDRRPVSYWREIVWGLSEKPYLAVQPPAHYGQKKSMSQWCLTDAVHSWTFNGYEGKGIIVEVYGNGDEVELLINGTSLGRKNLGPNQTTEQKKQFRALFDIIYQPGILETIVYKDGKEIGRDRIETADSRVHLNLAADEETIPADGSDIAYVELCVVDGNDRLNMDIQDDVSIRIEGPGKIIGFGSADPESEENYFDTTAKTYEGRLRAAVRAFGVGKITIICEGEISGSASVSIEAI